MAKLSACALCLLLLAICGAPVQAAERIIVFTAASTTSAMEEIVEAFAASKNHSEDPDIRIASAASSTLARQIAAGAPANLYLSANQQWMTYLAEQGLVDNESIYPLLGNALVLIVPADSAVSQSDQAIAEQLLALTQQGRIALGDPGHVPAGIYAKQALESLGLWPRLEPHFAFTADVRAALALVARGEVAAAIVYRSDTVGRSEVRSLATFPVDSHSPIVYPLALVKNTLNIEAAEGQSGAVHFHRYLLGRSARTIFERHGFSAVDDRQD